MLVDDIEFGEGGFGDVDVGIVREMLVFIMEVELEGCWIDGNRIGCMVCCCKCMFLLFLCGNWKWNGICINWWIKISWKYGK